MTEKQLQQNVLDLARLKGWLAYHVFDSRRSVPGFPDLVAVRGSRIVVAELKSATGRVTTEQRRWITAFAAVPGIEVHVWKPTDWPAAIVEALT